MGLKTRNLGRFTVHDPAHCNCDQSQLRWNEVIWAEVGPDKIRSVIWTHKPTWVTHDQCLITECACVTHMTLRRWQLTVVTNTATACPNDRFMPVKMYLSFQLVPQLVMLRTFHPTTQQLDLLDPAHSPPACTNRAQEGTYTWNNTLKHLQKLFQAHQHIYLHEEDSTFGNNFSQCWCFEFVASMIMTLMWQSHVTPSQQLNYNWQINYA